MSPQPLQHEWIDANQALLVAEFARLKALLAGEDDSASREEVGRCRDRLPAPAALDRLAALFGLSDFECGILLLAAGVEMDAGVAAECSRAGGERGPWATFALALSVLPAPHWSALTPVRPLRRWRLVEPAEHAPLATARLRIDERALHYLAGVNYLDQRLQPLLRPMPEAGAMAEAQRAVARELVATLAVGGTPMPLVQLPGDDPQGKQDVAAALAAHCGLQLHAVGGDDLPLDARELDTFIALWEREAALLESALLVECGDAAPGAAVHRFVERARGLIVLTPRESLTLQRSSLKHRIDKPSPGEQRRLWEEALGPSATRFNGAVGLVAAEFRLSARDIGRAGAEVAREAAAASDAEGLLWRACRDLERPRLEGLAQRIEPAARWDDLVLPEAQKGTLRRIAAHVRHRLMVIEEWGFAGKGSRGLGVSVLFAGESGTGKTMAGEVLADELRLELYRVDLSAVVSKYIGETEKNLARVFDAAEDGGIILLFDEADALFGKRSEVRDSHDRYANIEVSYLLQRMEAYRGLAILTTNQKAALDPAFHRRLRFVVHFPFPDAREREAIWRGILPAATPRAGLDYAKLARLHAAGGGIRNIALTAAFLAADGGEPVSMTHLLEAAHAEAAKREHGLTDGETRGWV